MQRRVLVAGIVTVLFTAAWAGGSAAAAEIRPGATVTVKANSIWFTRASMLMHWQSLVLFGQLRRPKGGDAQELSAYLEKALRDRDAWQFTEPLTVRVVSYERDDHRVKVRMTEPGRLQGTTWFLDDAALQP